MGIAISVFSQTFWALLGAIFGILLPVIAHSWKYLRRPELLGVWKSAYEGIDEPPGTWVTEELDIRVAKGRFCLNNADSSHGYNYTAWGHIAAKLYLVGDWESIRPGANAHGAFILTISAQGNSMYGYWVGPDNTGARRYGKWALGRDNTSLDAAKELCDEMYLSNRVA